MRTYILSILVIWSLIAYSQGRTGEIAKKCDSIFSSYDDKPGVAVLIVRDGSIAFKTGYGIANLEYNIPLGTRTVFDIASVSKQFTGYAIAQLIQQGKISPDDDIRKWLPEVPDFGKVI